MQDDKLDIQKILQDAPDEAVEPVNADQDTDDSDAVEPVMGLEDVMADKPVEEIEEAQEVMEDEPQEVVAPEISKAPVDEKPEPEAKEPADPLTAEEKKERVTDALHATRAAIPQLQPKDNSKLFSCTKCSF